MVKVRWIVGLKGIVVGLTKNMFAGFHYRPIPALIASGGLFVLATWPLIGLLVGPWFARLLCLLSLTTMVAAATVASPTPRSSPLYALGFPLAALVVIYIIYRSMLFTYRQGGIVWRGTLYPLEELRRGVA
jgi:hypothetical protein